MTGSDAGKFNHKVQRHPTPGSISMTVAAGMWNIALVTANTDFSRIDTKPVRSVARPSKDFEDDGKPNRWSEHYLCRNYARPLLMGNRLLVTR